MQSFHDWLKTLQPTRSKKPSPKPEGLVYQWRGENAIARRIYYLVIRRYRASEQPDRERIRSMGLKIGHYFVPQSGSFGEFSDEQKERIRLWKMLLSRPLSHRLTLAYSREDSPTKYSLVDVDLCLVLPGCDADAIARLIGAAIATILPEQTIRERLFQSPVAEHFWLSAIAARYKAIYRGVRSS